MMSDIIQEVLPEVNFGVMSGPNLAVEIMDNMPTATVIASASEPLRKAVQTALHSAFFRVFASSDIKGVELGGALKISMPSPWVWRQRMMWVKIPKPCY